MKKLLIIFVLILSLCIFGCSNQKSDNDKFTIVVTAFPHYDFARQLTKGLENVEIKMLIRPGNEVHTYEPTPADILSITQCDMFIYTGGEEDKWLKSIIENSDNNDMSIISFMDICEGHGDSHEGHGHSHDEHVWTNPVYVKEICVEIAGELCRKDSENSSIYQDNLSSYLSLLTELDNDFRWVSQNKIRDKIIMGDRFPFLHLAEQYGFHYSAAFNGCSSDTEPTAKTIAELYRYVHDNNIPYVFTIEFSNGKIADSITDKSDAQKLTLHSCHNVSIDDFDNGVTYIDLMKQNATNLRKALCE